MERAPNRTIEDRAGFTLIEVLVAMLLAAIVLAAVFGLLGQGQEAFRREPEVAETQQAARASLDAIARDLTMAGYKTPGAAAILWADGGGLVPDEITIVYADPEVPTAEPLGCGGAGGGGGQGPCGTIGQSSTLLVDPETMDPALPDPATAYEEGMVLAAIETDDCNGDGAVGFYPFELTQPPQMTSAGGRPTLNLNHNPGNAASGVNFPGGFNGEVEPDCAVIGRFRIVQYRVRPLPPAPAPTLERRDLSVGPEWIPLARNIETLQFQYATGLDDFADVPAAPPRGDDPRTWIHRVRVAVGGRSESRNLEGASAGVFDPDDTFVRRGYSTTVTLRNLAFRGGIETGGASYN